MHWIFDPETCAATQGFVPRGLDIVLSSHDDPSDSVQLSMGASATWAGRTPGVAGSYVAKDLASISMGETSDLSFVVARATSPRAQSASR
jgi:hypothetical protein